MLPVLLNLLVAIAIGVLSAMQVRSLSSRNDRLFFSSTNLRLSEGYLETFQISVNEGPDGQPDDLGSPDIPFIPRRDDRDREPGDRTSPPIFGGDACENEGELELAALVPGEENRAFVSRTSRSHPTFFFYVPYEIESSLVAEFSLLDENGDRVYRQQYSLQGTPGIVRIAYPETAPALEVDRDYYWNFSVICNPDDRADDRYVSGTLQRVTANKIPSPNATPEERAILYAADGLWYDTLSTIVEEIYPEDPQRARALLDRLFASDAVNLAGYEGEPIVPCCSAIEEETSSSQPE